MVAPTHGLRRRASRPPRALQLNQHYNLTYGARNAVACHEIGHFVGMGHSADASDRMSNVSFEQSIASPDIDQLRATWNAWGH